jgi:hypothetical protein
MTGLNVTPDLLTVDKAQMGICPMKTNCAYSIQESVGGR